MYEADVARGQPQELENALAAFEEKYGMSSQGFFFAFKQAKPMIEWILLNGHRKTKQTYEYLCS